MEKKMSAEIEVIKGIKVAAEEAARLDPQQIARLLPDAPPQGEVEGQTFCTSIQCPYCGKSGRCDIEPVPGKYYRCINCGSLFRT
jgi:DNA-directed RNA polymerase subunit RPC12/RpoP